MNSPRFPTLHRVPLVPDSLAKANDCYFEIDTRFRRGARLLQAFWLRDHNIPTGVHVRGEGDTATEMPLASLLDRDAARAGRNFIAPAVHDFVRRELILREEGAAIDEERLFGNALSSMPLTFNLLTPLALDRDLATAVFRQLLPNFVDSVEGIVFEHSPGRREPRFLNDGTAFDAAIRVITPEGEIASLFVEIKYSEDMTGPAARLRDRYDEASRQVRLFKDPDSVFLRTLALEQLWREHMLAQLAVDEGVTSRAVFVAIGPKLNRRVQAAFKVFGTELIDSADDSSRVAFRSLTLEAVVDAISAAGAIDLAGTLYERYLDFGRVYEAVLWEFKLDRQTPSIPASSVASVSEVPVVTPPVAGKTPLPPSQRRSLAASSPRTASKRRSVKASERA